jgi:hypothetical protein
MPALDGPGTSAISDHRYQPRGEWWSVCRFCGLAEAAHARSAVRRRCLDCDVTLVDTEPLRCGGCIRLREPSS